MGGLRQRWPRHCRVKTPELRCNFIEGLCGELRVVRGGGAGAVAGRKGEGGGGGARLVGEARPRSRLGERVVLTAGVGVTASLALPTRVCFLARLGRARALDIEFGVGVAAVLRVRGAPLPAQPALLHTEPVALAPGTVNTLDILPANLVSINLKLFLIFMQSDFNLLCPVF